MRLLEKFESERIITGEMGGEGNERTWPSQEMSQRCVVVCFPVVDWDTEEISPERKKEKDGKRLMERVTERRD